MRFLFATVVIIHGLIHLLGFFKAFDFAHIEALTNPISKPKGLLWLFTAVALISAAVFYLLRFDLWWILAFAAILLSQILIISSWSDARFGTIANIIILINVVIAAAQWNFGRQVKAKVAVLLENKVKNEIPIRNSQADSITLLKNWHKQSGADRTGGNVYLKQSVKMKLKPEENWRQASVQQWFSVNPPGFIWYAKVGEESLMSFTGRDSFLDGKGKMLIKIHALLPIVDAQNDQIDESTALRFLAESVWFPWAAKSSYVSWEVLNGNELKATFTYKDLTVSGIFVFDNQGLPIRFESMRFYDQTGKKEKWVVEINSYQKFGDLYLPAEAEVSWHLPDGVFKWYKLQVEKVEKV